MSVVGVQEGGDWSDGAESPREGFVGTEIEQQEDGRGQVIEGTANQQDLILQAIKSPVRFSNGDTKGMLWKGVSTNSTCR